MNTPWPSLLHKPGQTWREIKELLNSTQLEDGEMLSSYWNHKDYSFRIWKSHETPVPYPDLPYKRLESSVLDIRAFPNVRFVAMVSI